MEPIEGIVLIDKPAGISSFRLVQILRKLLHVKKIGHAGTLDPFATGVMILLVGRTYTRLSDTFLLKDKEYVATIRLGAATDTFDCEGVITQEASLIPTDAAIDQVLDRFQGEIWQTPPMFSAKKKEGKKLYELARQGIEVEREPVRVTLACTKLSYTYPDLRLKVVCSKGTYIRSLGHDIGQQLGCYGHLTALQRTRSGTFELSQCISGEALLQGKISVESLMENMLVYP